MVTHPNLIIQGAIFFAPTRWTTCRRVRESFYDAPAISISLPLYSSIVIDFWRREFGLRDKHQKPT
jgi:hypothetical protein